MLLATPRVVAACTNVGYEPFRYRFKTDHRGFFMDSFDNSVLFGNVTPTLASSPSRTLFSKSTKQRTTYVNSRWLYLVQHNWFDRLQQAMSSASVSTVFLEALDRDWTRSSLAAEQKCQGFPPGPYVHELVQLRRQKTILSHLISSMKIGQPF
jgi:hypothetical protein